MTAGVKVSFRRLEVATVIVASLGFLAVLLAPRAGTQAALLILAAAIINVLEEASERRHGTDEFSRKMTILSALVAFGIAPSVFVTDLLVGAHPALIILPLIYILASSIWLARYSITERLSGLPAVANGFVIPGLFLLDFYTVPIVAGWLILASALMAFEMGLKGSKGESKDYVEVEEPEEEREDEDDGEESDFVPFGDW